ncbi:hypothetical protein GCK32_004775 [Trichostrongylus colubriformis]|uniref:Uncharacterized protein n=1 Tax=Trichostrongylus colubriformis TaxID=6319 RepID=A0AAN8FMG8_TRICO
MVIIDPKAHVKQFECMLPVKYVYQWAKHRKNIMNKLHAVFMSATLRMCRADKLSIPAQEEWESEKTKESIDPEGIIVKPDETIRRIENIIDEIDFKISEAKKSLYRELSDDDYLRRRIHESSGENEEKDINSQEGPQDVYGQKRSVQDIGKYLDNLESGLRLVPTRRVKESSSGIKPWLRCASAGGRALINQIRALTFPTATIPYHPTRRYNALLLDLKVGTLQQPFTFMVRLLLKIFAQLTNDELL